MMHLVKPYFKFLFKSTNEHGVHSPFVFDLVAKCLYDKTPYPEYKMLSDFRKSLLQNQHEIKVTDFGAGSRVFKSDSRKISAIAKNAGISAGRAKLLFRLVKYFNPGSILEIGTSVGLATAALRLGSKRATITTIEGCRRTMTVAKEQFSLSGFPKTNFVAAEFGEAIMELPSGTKFDFVYFDGNHTKAATLQYFNLLLPTATNDTLWIFDDIHWSPEMEEAWESIRKNPNVTVTIDTFQWGLVFFRKQQEKEHFVIRA